MDFQFFKIKDGVKKKKKTEAKKEEMESNLNELQKPSFSLSNTTLAETKMKEKTEMPPLPECCRSRK